MKFIDNSFSFDQKEDKSIYYNERILPLSIPPPLPLLEMPLDFLSERSMRANTGFGYFLPTVPHDDNDFLYLISQETSFTSTEKQQECLVLSKYRKNLENEHVKSNDSITLYTRENHTIDPSKRIDMKIILNVPHLKDVSLTFDSAFESGNLSRVERVFGRKYESPCSMVDQEYDLYCMNDTHTYGNIQWYFFNVTTPKHLKGKRVRFNIKNMMKSDSLYNYGMQPVVYSTKSKKGWNRQGEEICYYPNLERYSTHKKKKDDPNCSLYTFSFVFNFQHSQDVVYFAHCYPYTYSHLMKYLIELEKCPQRSKTFKRKLLCNSLCGNRCDLLTITSFADTLEESEKKPAIVLSARVHPGETNSSYIMHGILNFLTGPSKEAQELRDAFVFKVIPMLNPDGVINGNYRCSVAGVDLNRRWASPLETVHPTIFYTKKMMHELNASRPIFMYCDIHGHSRKKNMFLYGCKSYEKTKESNAKLKLFPYLLCTSYSSEKDDGYFSYKDCTFTVTGSKRSTGRVVSWKEFHILYSFTLEASFCGNGNDFHMKSTQSKVNHQSTEEASSNKKKQYRIQDLIDAGRQLCQSFHQLIDMINPNKVKDINNKKKNQYSGNDLDYFTPSPELLSQLLGNKEDEIDLNSDEENNSSSGSDSEPSGDNLDPEDMPQSSPWKNIISLAIPLSNNIKRKKRLKKKTIHHRKYQNHRDQKKISIETVENKIPEFLHQEEKKIYPPKEEIKLENRLPKVLQKPQVFQPMERSKTNRNKFESNIFKKDVCVFPGVFSTHNSYVKIQEQKILQNNLFLGEYKQKYPTLQRSKSVQNPLSPSNGKVNVNEHLTIHQATHSNLRSSYLDSAFRAAQGLPKYDNNAHQE